MPSASQPPFPAAQLTRLLSWVHQSPHCDFYRTYWKKHGIDSFDTHDLTTLWPAIPPVSKETLAARTDPHERRYVDPSEIKMLRTTSGTTGGAPFLFWTSNFSCPFLYRLFKQKGASRGIMFCSSENFSRAALEASLAGFPLLYGDPHDLPRAVRFVEEAAVETLSLTPTLASIFAEYLARARLAERIHLVWLFGEQCTPNTATFLREQLPCAEFIYQYSQSEVNGTIGLSSSSDTCTEPYRTFHINTDAVYLETLEGEIVLTTLTVPYAQPLIRYRTGDTGVVLTEPCTCGSTAPRVAVHGRTAGDFVRAGGGEFKAAELERVLEEFRNDISPTFQLTLTESQTSGRTSVTPVLSVLPHASDPERIDFLYERIAAALRANLRISHTMTLGRAIDTGLVKPLRVERLAERTLNHKNPRIVFRPHA